MSIILRCPKCEKHYEGTDDVLKQRDLSCPFCGTFSEADDFSAMMFCPGCRGKLAVSLAVLRNKKISCPRCGKTFEPNISIPLDDDTLCDDDVFFEEAAFKPGDFFDKYEIIRLLGKGGMGEVYLARHLFLHREVALKIMLSSMAAQNPVFAKRFIREAKIANRISSPYLIPVFDVGIEHESETLFIAMEFINGINVSDMVKAKGVFDETSVLHIASKVACALEAMEAAHVVHRDIKPSNIMIDVNGNIKLADLGIAKSDNHAEGDLTLTQDSMVFGTPNYAPPEQCRASHDVDNRADIYSLGATMFHMVTGYPPFKGATLMDTMLKVINDPAPSLAELPLDLSPGFVALINDMLQKDPEKRPQTAAELRKRIDDIFQGDCGLRDKMAYFVRSTGKKLRPIGGLLTEFPTWLGKHLPWNKIKNALLLLFVFGFIFLILFFGVKRRDYFRVKFNEIRENLKNAEKNPPPAKKKKIAAPAKKIKKAKPAPDVNRRKLYADKSAGSNNKTVTENPEQPAKKITTVQPAVSKPQTADFAALAANGISAKTITGRLEECKNILLFIENNAAQKQNFSAKYEFYKKVRATLEKQRENQLKAEQKNNQEYASSAATGAVKRLYRTRSRTMQNASESQKKLFASELMQLLTNPEIDPNMQIEYINNSDTAIPLLNAVICRYFIDEQSAKPLIETLLKCHVSSSSVNTYISPDFLLCPSLLEYGIDRLDGLLLHAVRKRDKKCAEILLYSGAHANEKDSDGNSVLHWACRMNDIELVKILLSSGAEINSTNKTDLHTPLFWAEKYGSAELCDLLIRSGASKNIKDIFDKTAENYRYYREFAELCRTDNFEEIENYLRRYSALADNEFAEGVTALQFACKNYNRRLAKILLNANANVEKCGYADTIKPLMYVYESPGAYLNNGKVRLEKFNIFKDLLAAGADFYFSPDRGGKDLTLLHYSLKKSHLIDSINMNYVNIMLNYCDLQQYAPSLICALYMPFDNVGNNFSAEYAKIRKIVSEKIFKSNPDINLNTCPELVPICAGNIKLPEAELNLLLSKNADINGCDSANRTAVYRLCQLAVNADKNDIPQICKRLVMLFKHNASADCEVNGMTIADMTLPDKVADIPQIKTFCRRKSE